MHAKARKAQVAQCLRVELIGTVIEEVRTEADLPDDTTRAKLVDSDALLEIESLVKESDLEWKLVGTPQRTIWFESYVSILVVGKVLQLFGKFVFL